MRKTAAIMIPIETVFALSHRIINIKLYTSYVMKKKKEGPS